jgi:RNA polymerase sigma factor (sigma-70 family)
MDALAPVPRTGGIPRRLLRLRSDLALAERFAGGDEHAFAVLYERHRKSVLAVCMGVLGSRHDAEDAAQDAFAALAVSLRKGLPENLPAWLMKVARNAAIDVARRRRTDVRAEEGVPDRAHGREGGQAELESVMAGIRELPEAQRTALLMRELAGHSYREIAALLEVDEAAVHGLIARARISLRSYREAYEMSCAVARAALAAEPDGRRGDRTVRRHVRMCASCRAYKKALRGDARALRGLVPDATLPVGGGGALFSGLAAKGALIGGSVAQVTAACAVSVCAVGGIVLVAPHSGRPLMSRAASSSTTAARVLAAPHHRRRSSPAEPRPTVALPVVSMGAARALGADQPRTRPGTIGGSARTSHRSPRTRAGQRGRGWPAGSDQLAAPGTLSDTAERWSGAPRHGGHPDGHTQGDAAGDGDGRSGSERRVSNPGGGRGGASIGDRSDSAWSRQAAVLPSVAGRDNRGTSVAHGARIGWSGDGSDGRSGGSGRSGGGRELF